MSTIYDTFDFGYDPSIAEEPRPKPAPRLPALPSTAMVNQASCRRSDTRSCRTASCGRRPMGRRRSGRRNRATFRRQRRTCRRARITPISRWRSPTMSRPAAARAADFESPDLSGEQQGDAVASSRAELRNLLRELGRLRPQGLNGFAGVSELRHSWLCLGDSHGPRGAEQYAVLYRFWRSAGLRHLSLHRFPNL